MSYCRRSDGDSDLYCFASGSYETHVARSVGLPFDGQSFYDPDLQSFRKRLLHLREVGYRVPDHVFKRIDEEIAAGEK